MKEYIEAKRITTEKKVTRCVCDWCRKTIVPIVDWSEGVSDGRSWDVEDLCPPCRKKVGELLEAAGILVDWWYPKQKNGKAE